MKNWTSAALGLALTAALALTAVGTPSVAEAKRLGSGKSQGMQRDMPARTAPDAAPAKPAAPAATPGTPAAAGAAAAAPGKRSWMGPLAGLAAGLGLAALFSHLGMGAGLANFVMIALLAVGAFFLVRFLMARFGRGTGQTPALAGASAQGGSAATALRSQEPPIQRTMVDERPAAFKPAPEVSAVAPTALTPVAAGPSEPAPSTPAVTAAFVPASFDSEGFARIAKMIFIRMQTANDAADLNDLRRFTTPEMFASIRLELQERGNAPQTTDVVKVDADVLDVAQEAERQVVSVRFRGQVVEEVGAQPTAFDEIWHLVKPLAAGDDSAAWAIAGIEQSR